MAGVFAVCGNVQTDGNETLQKNEMLWVPKPGLSRLCVQSRHAARRHVMKFDISADVYRIFGLKLCLPFLLRPANGGKEDPTSKGTAYNA